MRKSLLALLLLTAGPALGQVSSFNNQSQVVPTTATNIFAAAGGDRVRTRLIVVDATILSGTATATTIWCAWGTAQVNPAVFGTNGFPLAYGIDDQNDHGLGINQGALNCIQPSGGHYARLEAY